MDRFVTVFRTILFICILVISILNITKGEENVAFGKSTTQSSNNPDGISSRAVDGNTDSDYNQGSCSHTLNDGTNWWCVDLLRDVDFQKIKIYNRNVVQRRLQGFEIRVSSNGRCNYNGYQQSTVCYKDTSTTLQDIYNITSCNQSPVQFNGRYVYISVENPNRGDKFLTLCEVEIFERCESNCKDGCDSNGTCNNCTTGLYGDKCETPCPTNCNGDCHKSTGNCNGGCKQGYWGLKCNNNCNKCHLGCQQNNGYCNSGGCISGYYGDKCDDQCPSNCNGDCTQNNGDCEECTDGYWGIKCKKQCPANCRQSKCDKNNGYCSKCKNYYWGDKCEKHCSDGISPLVAGIIGALASMVILLIVIVILVYCCWIKRNERDHSSERTVRYTSSDETTRPSYDNAQHDVTSSQIEAGPYESLDRPLPSPTYETLK